MKLPVFYKQDIDVAQGSFTLDEASSKHIVQVLRMATGEQLRLTDGKGNIVLVTIVDDNRKRCEVQLIENTVSKQTAHQITIAISPVKNSSRFEWFLEKATEIGVTHIVPLLCERTEKQHFKWERMNSILISAMLQSQQAWLPVLSEPVRFKDFINSTAAFTQTQKMIAHCEDETSKVQLSKRLQAPEAASLILIGPEGDFSLAEIELATSNQFLPVALGNTRLRTETAGIVAATLMCNR